MSMRWVEVRGVAARYQAKITHQQEKAIAANAIQRKIADFQRSASFSNGQIQTEIRKDLIEAALNFSNVGAMLEAIRDDVWKQGEIVAFGKIFSSSLPRSHPYWVGGLRLQSEPIPQLYIHNRGNIIVEPRHYPVRATLDAEVHIPEINFRAGDEEQIVPSIAFNYEGLNLPVHKSYTSLEMAVKTFGLREGLDFLPPGHEVIKKGMVPITAEDSKDQMAFLLEQIIGESKKNRALPEDLQSWTQKLFAEIGQHLPSFKNDQTIRKHDLVDLEAGLRKKPKFVVKWSR